MRVTVQEAPFDAAEVTRGMGEDGRTGALVTFTGIVRGDGGLTAMEIEHYPAMTEGAMREFAQVAVARFGLTDVAVVHRVGRLVPGEQIMMVAAAAPHRANAFAAAEFLMDWLKSRAPFWKKETRADGSADWVEAKDEDEDALSRW